jgi:hypothetical protein
VNAPGSLIAYLKAHKHMRKFLVVLILLLLSACAPYAGPLPQAVPAQGGAPDPYTLAGQAAGQMTATAVERGELERQAARTQNAAEAQARATQGAYQSAATATQAYLDSGATAAAMYAGQQTAIAQATAQYQAGQSTANAISMLSAEQRATVTGWAQAARATDTFATLTVGQAIETARIEQQNMASRGRIINAIVGAIIALAGAILLWYGWKIAGQLHRKAKADADKADSEAAQAGIRIIPQGFIFVVPGMDAPRFQPFDPRYQLPARASIAPVSDDGILKDEPEVKTIQDFLRLVAYKKQDSYLRYIPRYNQLGFKTADVWMQCTNWLQAEGYIEKRDRVGTVCTGNWNITTILQDIEDREAEGRPSPTISISPMRSV